MKILVNGCFDVLHPGHFNLLTYARYLAGEGGKVIVCLDEDEKVMIDKNIRRPIFTATERASSVLALADTKGKPIVSVVDFFQTNNMLRHLIKKYRPDIILKGSDWDGKHVVGEGELNDQGDPVKIMFYPRMDYSTTDIIKRVLDKNKPI